MSSCRGSADECGRARSLFARYAYPPNELGYCGRPAPACSSALAGHRPAGAAVRGRLGAIWSTSRRSAGLADPLDERVVEAYWVGNDLLAAADPASLVTFLQDRFRGQIGGTWRSAVGRGPCRTTASRSSRSTRGPACSAETGHPQALSVLQDCRIRTGTVQSVADGTATVSSAPLVWDGSGLSIGPAREESVRWSALFPAPSPGDLVSLHWDWICDTVTRSQADSIAAREHPYLSFATTSGK